MNDVVKGFLKIFGILGISFIIIFSIIFSKNSSNEQNPKIGLVQAIYKTQNQRFAVIDDGQEVYVKVFPKVGTELKYNQYKNIFGFEWNSAY